MLEANGAAKDIKSCPRQHGSQDVSHRVWSANSMCGLKDKAKKYLLLIHYHDADEDIEKQQRSLRYSTKALQGNRGRNRRSHIRSQLR